MTPKRENGPTALEQNLLQREGENVMTDNGGLIAEAAKRTSAYKSGAIQSFPTRVLDDLIRALEAADAILVAGFGDMAQAWDEGRAAGRDPRRYGDPDFWTWDDFDGTYYAKPGVDPKQKNPYRTPDANEPGA